MYTNTSIELMVVAMNNLLRFVTKLVFYYNLVYYKFDSVRRHIMRYKNAIVNEIVCECFFKETLDVNSQNRILDIFKTESGEVKFDPDLSSPPINNVFPLIMKVWRKNKTELIQIFNNRIAFNYLPCNVQGEYVGWLEVKSIFLAFLNAVDIDSKNLSWKNASICYVNKIANIDPEGFTLGKYIKCDGIIFPKYLSDVSVATDYILGFGNTKIEKNTQIKLSIQKKSDNNYTIINSIRIQDIFCKDAEMGDMIQVIHDEVRDIFNNHTISEYTKESIMGGLQ